MEGARVGIFEDNEQIHNILHVTLTCEGHTVPLQAKTMTEAVSRIDDIAPDDLDVAVVDGNLSKGTVSGEEGQEIARLLHEKFKSITVIGFSATGRVEGADVQVDKMSMGGLTEVANVIDQL